jgi:hypothetical protein
MGDLLINTFGPGKKSILSAGTHVGMAATSVLEPIVLLYRFTADEHYLEFAKYLVGAWNEENGPKVLETLLTKKSVAKTANGKAYEMLSNLVGLCELARVTGNRDYLQAALNAWEDVVAHRLYLTGSASQSEHFHDDYYLPNQQGVNVAETCVTTTWIQLNSQLLRLTGEARFGEQLEKTFYNHLAAAQRPDGAQWCYFTSLEGTKPYGPGINCCVSSGPRGMALVPQHVWLRSRNGDQEVITLNLFDSSRLNTSINEAPAVLDFHSEFPRHGAAVLSLGLKQTSHFDLRLRVPSWAEPLQVEVNGQRVDLQPDAKGWGVIATREWKNGDRVTLNFTLAGRMIVGEHGNQGKAALVWGPLVLAYDNKRNEGLPGAHAVGLFSETDRPVAQLKEGQDLAFTAQVRGAGRAEPFIGTFVPFAEAGRDGGAYRVWLRAPGVPLTQNASLLAPGQESRSREGNVEGSINDGDFGTFVVTFDGQKADRDWYAVTLTDPVTIDRVVFVPGKIFHDGGWFDTSTGKPFVQVQKKKGGRWETVGEMTAYPDTTAKSPAGLNDGDPQSFTARLALPVKAYGVRVIGKPACGDNPKQAFSSCAELAAFGSEK